MAEILVAGLGDRRPKIAQGSLVAGVPGKVVRTLSESEQQRISVNVQGYLHLVEQRLALEPLP
ncbi:MAG: hypothetical protein GEU83_04335 [Pseudonocardiaceae bacterium]|nr:hypothetical protein [Pseudonocardiaceae bacterium]